MAEIKLKSPVTNEEYEVYRRYFKALDPDRTRVVTAEVAKPFLEQTGFSGRQLGHLWSLVDLEGKGFVTFKEFCALIRCVSHLSVTPSIPITSSLYNSPATKIFQFNLPNKSNHRHRRSAKVKSVPLPLISSSDVARFSQLFDRTTGEQQLLPGDKAKDIFMKAKLPSDVLGDIWFLCDREQDGVLNKYEFIMAMHLIGLRLSQNPLMDPIPKRISRKLWESTGLPIVNSNTQSHHSSPSSSSSLNSLSAVSNSLSRVSSLKSTASSSNRFPRRYSPTLSTNGSQRTESPVITRTISGSSVSSRNSHKNTFLSPFTPLTDLTENIWEIQPHQYKSFQTTFINLDKNKTKELGPHILVPFFMKSGLTRETLANVWDLVDMNKSGTLNKKEFIIAMFLIERVRISRVNLPYKLPQELLESVERLGTKYEEDVMVDMGKEATTGLGISLSKTHTNPSIEKDTKETKEDQSCEAKIIKDMEIKKRNISKLNEQIEEANKHLENTRNAQTEYEKQLRELQEIEDSLIIKLSGINNSIQQSTTKIAKMEQSISAIKKNSEQLKMQLTVAEGNYHAMEAKVLTLDEEIKNSNEQNEKVKKEIFDMKSMTASVQPKLKAKEEEIKQKMELLDHSNRDLELEKMTVKNLQKELENLNNLFKTYEEKVTDNN